MAALTTMKQSDGSGSIHLSRCVDSKLSNFYTDFAFLGTSSNDMDAPKSNTKLRTEYSVLSSGRLPKGLIDKEEAIHWNRFLRMPPSPPQTPPPMTELASISTAKASSRRVPVFVRFGLTVPASLSRKKRLQSTWHMERGPNGECISVRSKGEIKKTKNPLRPVSQMLPNERPLYEVHIGEPCTLDALDHILGCGHRIITLEPEPCGANCHTPERLDCSQPHDLETPFVCMQCISDHLQARHLQRSAEYRTELETIAAQTSKSEDWIVSKLGYVDIAWQDQDVEEMRQLTEGGKLSHPFHIDPIPLKYRQLVIAALQARRQGPLSTHRSSVASMISTKSITKTAEQINFEKRQTSEQASASRQLHSTEASSLPKRESSRPQQWRQSMQQLFNMNESPVFAPNSPTGDSPAASLVRLPSLTPSTSIAWSTRSSNYGSGID